MTFSFVSCYIRGSEGLAFVSFFSVLELPFFSLEIPNVVLPFYLLLFIFGNEEGNIRLLQGLVRLKDCSRGAGKGSSGASF